MRRRVTIRGSRRDVLEMLASGSKARTEELWPGDDLYKDKVSLEYEGNIDVEVEDLERFVVVEFLDPDPSYGTDEINRKQYTFIDGINDGEHAHFRPLEAGDIVVAPTRRGNFRAIVRRCGANIPTEHVRRRITRRLMTGSY